MDQLNGLRLSDLGYLAPELTLVISAVILSLLDLFMPAALKRTILGWLTVLAVAISAYFVIQRLGTDQPISLLNESYRIDDFGNLMKLVFLGGTGLIVFMSLGTLKEDDVQHQGEFYYLFLPAVLGAMIMASSGDLITLFVGLETLSITSYIMVGIKKRNVLANEAGFKYLALGAVSSAIILYGMSFLYGMTGTTRLLEIRTALEGSLDSFGPLVYMSFFLLLAGFGFKIAAAPFHSWAPDVYQGAATPVTAFLAVVSKGAAFAIVFRVFTTVYYGVGTESSKAPIGHDGFLAMAAVAAAAMILGNTMALRQTDLKRLMAYSGIANAGYLLVPVASGFSLVHYTTFQEMLFYLIAYLFMNVGAFALIMILEHSTGETGLKALAGLYYRAPWTAAAMVLIILSLAGIPVTGGFFGKIFIMLGAMENHQFWLAAVMILTSVVSFYYYFGMIRQMFMRYDEEAKDVKPTLPLTITLWVCAAAGLLMGFFPHVILEGIQNIFSLGTDLFGQP
ncbi:NADH-quinone oxidoreductase subunit N [Gorillibacterium sp. sgz5001074]|uniref:NADH-quinone oxidoreductase subunit N n=1 Tax=Gorillibacterium sp. sgz5001074 TaxID=3446695 RepID=UPI003F666DA9